MHSSSLYLAWVLIDAQVLSFQEENVIGDLELDFDTFGHLSKIFMVPPNCFSDSLTRGLGVLTLFQICARTARKLCQGWANSIFLVQPCTTSTRNYVNT